MFKQMQLDIAEFAKLCTKNQSVTPFVAGAESPYGSSRGGETPLPPLVPNGRPGTSQGENNSMNEGGLNAWEEKSEIVEKTEQ